MAQSILHEVVVGATNIADSTKEKYLRDLNEWIRYAGVHPQGWTRRVAQNFYATLLARMKPQSANRLFASVEFASRWWAIQEDNPAFDFARVMKAKPSDKIAKISLTEDQARCLLATCLEAPDDPIHVRDFALMVVALETGMRRMSLRSMTFEQTFLDGDTQTGYPTTRVLMKGKRSERLFVPLSDVAISALKRWLAWLAARGITRGPIFCSLERRIERGRGTIVWKASKTSLAESAIHKIVMNRGKPCDIDISPHVFRHTFVTWRLAADYPPHEVAAMTSHKLVELKAMGEYANRITIGGKIRNSTPAWLAQIVLTAGGQ